MWATANQVTRLLSGTLLFDTQHLPGKIGFLVEKP